MKKKRKRLKLHYSQDDLFAVIESLLVILESGTDIGAAISAIADDSKNKRIKRMLKSMSKDLNGGLKLWETFEKHEFLPKRNIEIIKIGEEGGLLLENLGNVVKQRRFEKELTSQVKSALIYPFIIMMLGILVAIGTVWFILPRLTLVYSGLDLELPLITRVLIQVGEAVSGISPIYVLLFFILLILFFVFGLRYQPIRIKLEKVLLRTPGVRRIVHELEISRMGTVMGGLLTVGVTIDRALLSLSDSTPLQLYKERYKDLHEGITRGESFRNYFKKYSDKYVVIPSTVQQMIHSSERSGNLPYMFTFLGEQYRDKVKATAQNLTVVLEPAMLIMMWLFVGVIALAIVLPIYSLIGSL